MKIIVLPYYDRTAMALMRGLEVSYEVVGGEPESGHWLKPDRFFKSPRVKSLFRYRDLKNDPAGCLEDIKQACRKLKATAIQPTDHTMTNWLSYHKKEIQEETGTVVMTEDFEKLKLLADKWNCYQQCLKTGVPTPRTALLSNRGELDNLLRSFSSPLIIKPRNSSGSIGIRFFQSIEELRRYLHHTNYFEEHDGATDFSFVVQEVIRGKLFDVTTFSQEGVVAAMLTQQRMVTQFDFGGPGIINKTTDIPVLREYAERLVRKLNWNGPILFDFIRDEHNRYYLLECNPRFWGTTELTIEAGLNVAQMCADLFVLGKPLEKKLEYELDLVYKWVPSCILYWFRSPRSPQRCVARVAQTLRSHGARRTATDLRLKNVPDLLGRALNRLSL